jgi:hypothetical protein
MATTLPPPVTCSVIEQRVGDTLAVQGRIAVREAADGRYAMKVRKVSRSGTTFLNQAGTFQVARGGETAVGAASFNIEPGISYRIELTVTIGSQTYTCKLLDKTGR